MSFTAPDRPRSLRLTTALGLAGALLIAPAAISQPAYAVAEPDTTAVESPNDTPAPAEASQPNSEAAPANDEAQTAAVAADRTVTVTKGTGDKTEEGTLPWAAEEFNAWLLAHGGGGTFTVQIDPSVEKVTLTEPLRFQRNAAGTYSGNLSIIGGGNANTMISVPAGLTVEFTDQLDELNLEGVTFESEGATAQPTAFVSMAKSLKAHDLALNNMLFALLPQASVNFNEVSLSNAPLYTAFSANPYSDASGTFSFTATDSTFVDSPAALIPELQGVSNRHLNVTLDSVIASGTGLNPGTGEDPSYLFDIRRSSEDSESSNTLTIRNSTFEKSRGGAVRVDRVDSGEITGSTFNAITHENQPAVGIALTYNVLSSTQTKSMAFKLSNNTFTGNSGGPAFDLSMPQVPDQEQTPWESVDLQVTDNLFADNTVEVGDGVFSLDEFSAIGVTSAAATFERNVFQNNNGKDNTEGILNIGDFRVSGADKASLRIADSLFTGNSSVYGADIYLEDSETDSKEPFAVTLDRVTTDSSKHTNVAPDSGRALRVGDIDVHESAATLHITNSTFTAVPTTSVPLVSFVAMVAHNVTTTVEQTTVSGGPLSVGSIDSWEGDDAPGQGKLINTVIDSGEDASVLLPPPPMRAAAPPVQGTLITEGLFVTAESEITPDATVATSAEMALEPLKVSASDVTLPHGDGLPTMVPGKASVLLNAGVRDGVTATDQRGLPRLYGKGIDPGAVERYNGTVNLSDSSTVTEGATAKAVLTWTGFDGEGKLAGYADGPLSATVSTADGSAKTGVDYTATTKDVKLEAPGTSEIEIPTLTREGKQGDRTFDVVLSKAPNATTVENDSVTVTIVDDASVKPNPEPGPGPDPKPNPEPSPSPEQPKSDDVANTGSGSAWLSAAGALALVAAGAALALGKRARARRG